jgi:hypothetical protein
MAYRPPAARDMALLLILFSLLLVTFQFVSLVKLETLDPGVSYITLSLFVKALAANLDFDWLDGLLAVLIVTTVVAVAIPEIWQRRLTAFLECYFASERRTLVLLAMSCLLGIRYYFAPGNLSWGADAPQHIDYAYITSQAISQLELPHWTNYLAGGTRYLQFYGVLFFGSSAVSAGRVTGLRVRA